MKYYFLFLLLFSLLFAEAQLTGFLVHQISLPEELKEDNNQFSGLAVDKNNLFIISESRIQEGAAAKLYTISLTDLEQKIRDTSFRLPCKRIPIKGLEVIRKKIGSNGDEYEGLEGLIIETNLVYFSIETSTNSPNGYLIKGCIRDSIIEMDTSYLRLLPKPKTPNGHYIHNAGFEAILKQGDWIYTFYEFNYFAAKNIVYGLHQENLHAFPIKKLPFRVTDITIIENNRFIGLNFFFKGEGEDAIYRPLANDAINSRLVKRQLGYRNYCRLIEVRFNGKKFVWESLWEFPDQYAGYNWEGLTAYKNGYLVINDKYSPEKPFFSTLIYLEKQGK